MVEIIAYYLIAAISFALIYLIRYSIPTIKGVEDALSIMHVEDEYMVSKTIYYSTAVAYVTAVFPYALYTVITEKREDHIMDGVKSILEEFYDIKK